MKKSCYMNLFVPFIHETERSHPKEKSDQGVMDQTPNRNLVME